MTRLTQESIKLRLCTACCSLHDAADGGGVGHSVHADVEVSAVARVPAILALPAVRGHVLAAGVVLAEEHLIAHGARVAHLAVRVLLPVVCTSFTFIRLYLKLLEENPTFLSTCSQAVCLRALVRRCFLVAATLAPSLASLRRTLRRSCRSHVCSEVKLSAREEELDLDTGSPGYCAREIVSRIVLQKVPSEGT